MKRTHTGTYETTSVGGGSVRAFVPGARLYIRAVGSGPPLVGTCETERISSCSCRFAARRMVCATGDWDVLRLLTRVAIGTAVFTLSSVANVLSGPWITQTACNTVLLEGVPHPQVTLEVRNVFPYPNYPVYIMLAVPVAAADSALVCTALHSVAPETWATYIEPTNGHVVWGQAYENSTTLFPGETLGGFVMVLSRGSSCCFDFYFSGAFEPFAHERVCFECDAAVPVSSRTWGAVKAMYR